MSPLSTVLQYILNAIALQISMDIASPKTNVTSLPFYLSRSANAEDSCIAFTKMDTFCICIHSPGLLQRELDERTHKS